MNKKWMTTAWMVVVVAVLVACGDKTETVLGEETITKKLSKSDVLWVKPQLFEQSIAFTGTLSALKQATVSAESGGTLARLLVNEGVAVQPGQLIAVMDNQNVQQSVAAQQAQVQNTQASLALANTKLKQQQVLFSKGFVSQLALEQAQNEYQVAAGNHKAQVAELNKLTKNQADAQITAPIGGVVYDKLVNEGELVAAGGQILKIAQTATLEIAATLSSEQVAFVKVGQEVKFSVAQGAPEHVGKVARINPVANETTRQFTVFVQVPNADAVLKVGQFAQGRIVLQNMDNALVVPNFSVRGAENAPFVYVVAAGKVAKREVTLVLQDAHTGMSVVEGLQADDVVLRTELLGVQLGDAVVVPAMEQ